jgi:hypothetical protein
MHDQLVCPRQSNESDISMRPTWHAEFGQRRVIWYDAVGKHKRSDGHVFAHGSADG